MNRSYLKRDILYALECEPVTSVTAFADALDHLRPAVSRALSQLQQEGMTRKQGRMWTITESGIQKVRMMQEEAITDMLAAQVMAKWLHEEYGDLAIANGYDYPDVFDTPWEQLPDDDPHKRLMVMVCLKFLQGKVRYTVDDETQDESTSTEVAPERNTTVFQDKQGGREQE